MNKEEVKKALEHVYELREKQREKTRRYREYMEWSNIAIASNLGTIDRELGKVEQEVAINHSTDIDVLYGDYHNATHTRYDVCNNALKTVEGAVYGDRPSVVYVKSVDGVPVHDTIEIKGVDRYGTAYTFEGHGIQARNGKWYEKFESGEWELVVKGG